MPEPRANAPRTGKLVLLPGRGAYLGIPTLFVGTGFLEIVVPSEAEKLQVNVIGQRAFGTPVELLMTEQAIELEAWWDVTRTTIAADEPESGHLDPIAATLELLERARGNGAELGIGKDVSVVEMGRGGLAGVKTSVNRLAAPLIVVTP